MIMMSQTTKRIIIFFLVVNHLRNIFQWHLKCLLLLSLLLAVLLSILIFQCHYHGKIYENAVDYSLSFTIQVENGR